MKLFLLLSSLSALGLYGETTQPNIILLLSDDQHWNETSVQMHPDHEDSMNVAYDTPNLEKMAASGMRFSSAYAPSPVCSPTRASIQTGLTPAQLNWGKASPALTSRANQKLTPPSSVRSLKEGQITFASLLNNAGYTTAHYGKWHLQGGGPENHGYDESDGDLGNEASGKYKDPNPTDIFGMTERAIEFMKKAKNKKKPFFIQMSYLALHSPENASAKNIERAKARGEYKREKNLYRQALTMDLDEGVGRLLSALDTMKLEDNTYVIYMSDNGARSRRGNIISGHKGSLGEGGVRAVFIARGPGIKENSWCHERVVGYDLFPSFCDFAGVTELPPDLMGGSLQPLLLNEGALERRSSGLVFHFPHYQETTPVSSYYEGDYKLLYYYESKKPELYNIQNDIDESENLTTSEPEKTETMLAALRAQLEIEGASIPAPNEDYDPSKPSQSGKGKQGKKKR